MFSTGAKRVDRFRPRIINRLSYLFLLLLSLTGRPHAVSGEADQALQAFKAAYWNAPGKYYYKLDNKTDRLDFWMVPHVWETMAEAYVRTRDTAYSQQITDIYDGFVKFHGSDWTTNAYNDDIMWWVVACLHVYEITSDSLYLNQAKKHFDWIYRTQVDTVFGGGVWWKNDSHTTKNSCIVQPTIIAAANLARLLGVPAYRAKAESLFAWQKRVLTEPGGKVYDAINFSGLKKGSTTYNQGTFIGAALVLDRVADAEKAAAWTRANMSDANGILRNSVQGDGATFNQIFVRYVMQLARRPGGESHMDWMRANAATAWKNRRLKDNVMGYNWAVSAPTSGIESQGAAGGVTALNLTTEPLVSLDPRVPILRAAKAGRTILEFSGRGVPVVGFPGDWRAVDGRRLPIPASSPPQ